MTQSKMADTQIQMPSDSFIYKKKGEKKMKGERGEEGYGEEGGINGGEINKGQYGRGGKGTTQFATYTEVNAK